MTRKKKLYQKIAWLVAIGILLIPIYILGNPSQRQDENSFSSGGILSRQRAEADLSEANLGKIDPTGSAMKLATFGMRGVAISLLWHRSQEYEKRADWDNVVATANQIITLEPHFITIWDFVGWQLAYNASAMFDDYRERYRWVIRGFEFVQDGTQYNKNAPKLFVRSGWTISQKVGIADEKKQYRRLFREDDELAERQSQPGKIYVQYRDNWLLGHAFYKKAEDLYENKNGDIGKETRLLFFGRAPLNRIRFAEWMSIDGCGVTPDGSPLFDEEHCEAAWKLAEEDWKQYSNKEVVTTIPDKVKEGEFRRTSLDVKKEAKKKINEYEDKLVEFLPEGMTKESIIWERWNLELDDQQRAGLYEAVLDPPNEDDYNSGKDNFPARVVPAIVVRDYLDGKYGEQPEWKNWREDLLNLRMSFIPEDRRELAEVPRVLVSSEDEKDYSSLFDHLNEWQNKGYALLRLRPEVLASYARDDKKAEAQDIVGEIEKLQSEESFSRMMREIMGADFHEAEVSFNQTAEARKAREHRQAVRDKFNAAQFEDSNKEFLACFDSWTALLKRPGYEYLRHLPQMKSELMDEVEKYVIVLEQLETVFPNQYSFQEVVRSDESVKAKLKGSREALDYVQKLLDAGKFKEARDAAEKLLVVWVNYNEDAKYLELGPLPETVDAYFDALKLWVQAWNGVESNERQLAADSGVFSSYPGKVFAEFIMLKKDDVENGFTYGEIERLEVERTNNVENDFELLEKEMGLWAKLVDRAPVLQYDKTSEITGRIQNAIQEYLLALKSQNKPEPDDFPLKSFPRQ